MALEETLRKIKYDLLRSDDQKVIQRLTGLLCYFAYPGHLEIRRMLGELYWKHGNRIEAGRYWYLEAEKTAEMLEACTSFEKACGNQAYRILQRLRFQGNLEKLREQYPNAFTILRQLTERTWSEFEWKNAHPIYGLIGQQNATFESTNHVLVVDSTGLLKDVALGLTSRWNGQARCVVSVLVNDPQSLSSLQHEAAIKGVIINPILVDYRDLAALDSALLQVTAQYGKFDYAVFWIRGSISTYEIIKTAAPYLCGQAIRILDSAAADPETLMQVHEERKKIMALLPKLGGTYSVYSETILGFVYDKAGSRWLTQNEITEGILRAKKPGYRWIVGTVRPWEARPSSPEYP